MAQGIQGIGETRGRGKGKRGERLRLNAGRRPARGAREEGIVYITFTLCKPAGRSGGVRQGQVLIMGPLSERRSRKPSDRKGNWVPWHEACRPPVARWRGALAPSHAEPRSSYGRPNEPRGVAQATVKPKPGGKGIMGQGEEKRGEFRRRRKRGKGGG